MARIRTVKFPPLIISQNRTVPFTFLISFRSAPGVPSVICLIRSSSLFLSLSICSFTGNYGVPSTIIEVSSTHFSIPDATEPHMKEFRLKPFVWERSSCHFRPLFSSWIFPDFSRPCLHVWGLREEEVEKSQRTRFQEACASPSLPPPLEYKNLLGRHGLATVDRILTSGKEDPEKTRPLCFLQSPPDESTRQTIHHHRPPAVPERPTGWVQYFLLFTTSTFTQMASAPYGHFVRVLIMRKEIRSQKRAKVLREWGFSEVYKSLFCSKIRKE